MQKKITRPSAFRCLFRLGSVNCSHRNRHRICLIDTGVRTANKHAELQKTGCKLAYSTLILLTHGDFDHTGNAAYLRTAFGGKIAMHADDAGMVSGGDMFVNRKKPNIMIRMLLPVFFGLGSLERFTPDLLIEDGVNLSEYGIDARVISIPGHSKGSIGILTSGGDLFCGDLLVIRTSRLSPYR
jgi:glyoxylase-like metal-dependent hydrolase (beta-lactamase superfamily II)